MTPLATRTVGDLVAEDARRGATFKRFDIDFCCGGQATLAEACRLSGADLATVAEALRMPTGAAPQPRVAAWPPAFLADYIVAEHHAYVRENIPALRALTDKIARVHGAEHPKLIEVARLFDAVAADLEEHMEAEETVVFPRIAALGQAADGPPLRDLVGDMEAEHDEAGRVLRDIRLLTDGYTAPADACASYRAALAGLEAFEDDLHRHVHLENHVLFPKALALEAAEVATP